MPTATATPLTARRAAFTVDELQAEVWTRPLTAAQWVARDPDDIPHVGYNYRFGSDDLDAIKRCHDEHGFCIVESVLTDAEVASLREGVHRVMPAGDMDEGTSLVRHAFVEFCPEAQQLLLHDKAMAIQCKLLGVVVGRPRPNKGTGAHYTHSYRWLRFPCCGRAYPCAACRP